MLLLYPVAFSRRAYERNGRLQRALSKLSCSFANHATLCCRPERFGHREIVSNPDCVTHALAQLGVAWSVVQAMGLGGKPVRRRRTTFD